MLSLPPAKGFAHTPRFGVSPCQRRVTCSAQILLDAMKQWANKSENPKGANLYVSDVVYHPAGCEEPILQNVGLCLHANELGLVFGRSGSGKTTLMQVIAGLSEASTGEIWITDKDLTDGELLFHCKHLLQDSHENLKSLHITMNRSMLFHMFLLCCGYCHWMAYSQTIQRCFCNASAALRPLIGL